MKHKSNWFGKDDDYGEEYALATCLWDKPLTLQEITEQMVSTIRRFGFVDFFMFARYERDFYNSDHFKSKLDSLQCNGWIEKSGNKYVLTELGRQEAEKPIRDYRRLKKNIYTITQPKTVSLVSLGAHLFLALIKLPAGLLSGSIGLLNDAIDTLLDGLACLLVYFGIHFKRERAVNNLLVLIMLVTGLYTTFEAVMRFFYPISHSFHFFTFFAALFSAFFCTLLYFYQRWIGLKSGNVALITQSVDSRNHVIVALSVTAGLSASKFHFPFLDTLIGLVVALVILKSAIELLIDILKSGSEEDMSLSRYSLFLSGSYEKMRKAQIKNWMLYLLSRDHIHTKEELLMRIREVFDFNKNVLLREMGLADSSDYEKVFEPLYDELLFQGFVSGDKKISITDSGIKYINQKMRC